MTVGRATEKYVALHLAVAESSFEAIGDCAAFMARLEFHAYVTFGKFADYVAFELF